MSDPLQEVLAAEAAARQRLDEARSELESELRHARMDAKRIKERNEERTRTAVEKAETRCAAKTDHEIERLNEEFDRQMTLDDASIEERLDRLVRKHVDQLWPG